jgi:hypothetical protein
MNQEQSELDLLVARVGASAGLAPEVAQRVVEDVIAFHAETPEAYVLRRHRELTDQGWRNADIFHRLAGEVAGRPFAGPQISERQIRRMIYG